ncbi:MAG: hypothetical protein A3H59_02595 [Candidatus Jacksonbacteria bacterium RIFCSPLOWO2_02_FULL_43_9]|nr:MAG: hypothetical protein UV70_C0005G0074 [Parcubacteria group bacterium GW2011_GWA2_43_13]OGY68614.1 MAG: hypothetical protein A3B94_01545 [Candidatus Jacksonbacteria bacterium RIFCSPHIGHO2_02_FULL_43_10]OGY71402.1 MAG: hypothetical protein A2986_01600 [Candidatus Jacksonbacteria bacterium RIFCSPLOWO2_01_FULL_44_13]OGY73154.1 MAG: hypothetical protein A3H59_02595 [Candidatus Jacksonbacteria bacterium RIFCSPLOWO2_02_FULL_43_9]HAZ17055.1 hypothetical protein [Candidatus Jacksonbacteria bacter
MKKFFILGNHPEISRTELEAVNRRDGLDFVFSHVSPAVTFADCDATHAPDPVLLMRRLAGVVKVGTIIDEVKEIDDVPALAMTVLPEDGHKVFLGISIYDAGAPAYGIRKKQKEIGMAIKELARRKEISLRFVVSREPTLSSVVVAKNHLLDRGAEIVLFATRHSLLVGKTEAVQEFEAYGDRDFSRPARDAQSGMLPPKLAHIMVNLSECPYTKTILDPFCGSGTILQEALMIGYTHVIGTDQSSKAVADTQRNIDWMREKKMISDVVVRIVQSDINALDSLGLKEIGAVASEPYLGPPLRGNESEQTIRSLYRQLDELYSSAIEKISHCLDQSGTVVWTLPELMGYAFDWPLFWRVIEVCGFEYASSDSMRYQRSNQHLARIIYIFTKAL